MSEYFPEPTSSEGRVELDLSNYATKADNATDIDTSEFAKNVD